MLKITLIVQAMKNERIFLSAIQTYKVVVINDEVYDKSITEIHVIAIYSQNGNRDIHGALIGVH